MVLNNNLFKEPYELEAWARSDTFGHDGSGVPIYKKDILRGYREGINRLFEIFWIFKEEMGFIILIEGKFTFFDKVLSVLYKAFYYKLGRLSDLENAVVDYIKDLKNYRFRTMKPEISFFKDSTDIVLKGKDITIDKISRMIQELRSLRIEFYETILEEYVAHRDQYNQRLREYLESMTHNDILESDNQNSLLNLNIENFTNPLSRNVYHISLNVWLLKDLLLLENPQLDKYIKDFQDLPRYRINSMDGYKEGIDNFFKIFQIFKKEMGFILTENLDGNFFEKTLSVLIRDFINEFSEESDLEDTLTQYIADLENFKFFSYDKETLIDKISQMIYNLRHHRIAFFEDVLQEYLSNRDEYNKKLGQLKI